VAAAHLSRLTEHEKASLRTALKCVIDAARRNPAHPSARRISALKRIVAALEEPGHPGDFDELILMLEAVVLAAARPSPLH